MQGRRRAERDEDGFTLVELLVALLIMSIVMAAVAPAFYELMNASSASDQRSVADGLAVAANEQIRSFPYWQVGYTSGQNPAACTAGTAVTVTSSPLDSLPTQTTVSNTTYHIQSCVYWETASDGSTAAYKDLVVEVTWGSSGQYYYTLSSALYPGAQGAYTTGKQNFPPGYSAGSTGLPAPPAPVVNSVSVVSPTALQVDWQPVAYSAVVQYWIEYWTVPAGTTSCSRPATGVTQVDIGNGASDGNGGIVAQVTSGISSSTTYCVDVFSQSANQSSLPSAPAGPVQTTPAAAGTPCSYSIAASPTSPVIDSSGDPVGWSSISVTVGESPADCATSPLSVYYGLNGSSGTPQAPLTQLDMVASGGGLSGSTDQAKWSDGTYGFVLYMGGSATPYQANVTPCIEKGGSGKC